MTVPVYIKIHDDIKNKIENGSWKVGTRIPSERKLSEQYGVSRMTFRQAVQALVEDGILKRVAGSGTYVTNQKVQEKMSGVTSFTNIMLAQGKQPSTKTLSYKIVEPTFKEASVLGLSQDDRVLRMNRIRYGDEVPICYEVAAVNASMVEGLSEEDVSSSLYRSLEDKKGLRPRSAKQFISAILATDRIAELLDIDAKAPILKLKQISYLQNQQPFEFVQTQYAAERFEFYLNK
ncbi:GntR family transcriptional regulator [Fructilactobacillus fructivorans]|uniref:GntR family transcriptional regulator n=1 Tax=Fructilactobacillus fructivorans TaxID=1614 RepID=UPI00070526EE|nr:GntR family transcriptional regulator [Fructilactobacillus fructivorans]KRN40557.1 GntR family transcriptional regulator [Fructilactobacillus fructivorans]KRN42348.1 GntR family transcriptional regulator [Fructilactobacillus fructivorans]